MNEKVQKKPNNVDRRLKIIYKINSIFLLYKNETSALWFLL